MLSLFLKSSGRLNIGLEITNFKINALDLTLGYRQTVIKMGG